MERNDDFATRMKNEYQSYYGGNIIASMLEGMFSVNNDDCEMFNTFEKRRRYKSTNNGK